MALQNVRYRFVTKLAASRPRAYAWATDYSPKDLERAGLRARRKVERLADSLVLLTDTFESDPFSARPGSPTVKTKLVHLYPDQWAWTATHIAGPAIHSQFLYRLTARGPDQCTLDFQGSQVETVRRAPTAASIVERARTLKREDSQLWVRFASELAREIG